MAGAETKNTGSGLIQVKDINKHFTAICMIECTTPKGKRNGGTGFIGCFSNNLLVLFTNNHVIPTAECAEEALFTFGYRDKENKGTVVAGDELFDTKIWQTNQPFMEHLVERDFTMIGVKEDKIKELGIHPFDLTPSAVAENDQLMIPQHPLTEDYKEATPLAISLGPIRHISGFLMLYDCKTFNGSSGSPVLKEVNGELQVVGIHRGILNETYYNISTLFSEVYKYVNSDDKKVSEVTKAKLLEIAGKVKWKPVEMADLIRVMKPVRAAWEELAYNLIKKDETSLKGLVSGIRRDGNFSTVNDDALSKVVEKWLGRTIRKHRTWQTLLGVAEKFDDHEMLKFLKKNHITKDDVPEMRHVNKWAKVSRCRSDWYEFACVLLPHQEARAIEGNLEGGGSKKCLRKVLEEWMSRTANPTWGMVVDALVQLPETTEVMEAILAEFKLKL